jgi:hypothetical protein
MPAIRFVRFAAAQRRCRDSRYGAGGLAGDLRKGRRDDGKKRQIIANLTPFAGASADAGTLIEVGWFLGKGKPIVGYSNTPENFESRVRRQLGARYTDLGIEGFHLLDNLMIVGAIQSGGYPVFIPTDSKARGIDALDVFESCVAAASRYFAKRP